jgi:hypothetical protein
MDDQTPEAPAQPAEEAPKLKKTSTLRIILFAILALAIVDMIVDQNARRTAREMFEILKQARDAETADKAMTAADVHKLIGREPDEVVARGGGREIYSWQGGIWKYTIIVDYRGGDPSQPLADVSMENEWPFKSHAKTTSAAAAPDP